MSAAARAIALVFSLLGFLPALHAEPRWKIQYLYDQPGSNFDIRDIVCPSKQRCVAAGVITDRKEHEQGTVVVTADSGAHWSKYDVKELPISLFFLDETLGWMVTDHGLWSTVEGGRSWTKVENRKGILQTHFLDANHGYIAGASSLFAETLDGGKTWSDRPEAKGALANPRLLIFDSITFTGPHGIVVGEIDPAAPVPDLAYPAAVPTDLDPRNKHVIILETLDSGKSWTTRPIPIDAQLGRLRISKQGFALVLVVYPEPRSPLASAVFQVTLGQSKSRVIFGERDRTAIDVALLDDAGAVLAAVEPPGNSPQIPIPGKLKILESRNLKLWQEMDVDYRAVAQSAVIAVADPHHIWVATDTGAILGLIGAD